MATDIYHIDRKSSTRDEAAAELSDNPSVSRGDADQSRQGSPDSGTAACAEDCLLDVAEVADYLRISRSMVYKLIENGRIPAIRLGRLLRVSKSELNEALKTDRRSFL